MESSLKKIKLKLQLITGTDILLMVGKGIRKRIWHAIHRFARANKKYMKGYDRNKESSYLKHWNANNLYGWEMSRKLPVDGFKWVENKSQFNKDFKYYNKDSDEGYFLEVDVQHPEKLHIFYNDAPLITWKNKKWKSWKSFSQFAW